MSQHTKYLSYIQSTGDPESALCKWINGMKPDQRVAFLKWVGWGDGDDYRRKKFDKDTPASKRLMRDLGLRSK